MIDPITIQELLVSMAWVTPIVVGLVAVFRETLRITDRFVPALSLVVGIFSGLLFVELGLMGGAVGLVLGLSASGLYDVGKKTVLGA